MGSEGDLLFHPEGGLFQRQLDLDGQILPPGGSGGLTASERAPAPESAASERATEQVLEQVAEAAEAIEAEAAGAPGAAAQALVAVGVVKGALLLIGEHLIGLGGFFELLLTLGIGAVDIGM